MRLPRDPELPAGLKTLSRLQFIHGFVVVAVATAIWLPSPTVAQSWVTLVALLAALHVLLQVGLYTGSALAREDAGLVPMAALLLVAACATPFLPAWASTPLIAQAALAGRARAAGFAKGEMVAAIELAPLWLLLSLLALTL